MADEAKKEPRIIYEPHPVSPERKAELRAQGCCIVDAIYAPPEQKRPAPASAKVEKAK